LSQKTTEEQAMTGLLRTDLSTSHKAHLAASAFSQQGEYGTTTALAREYAVSRPTVYAAARAGQAVLEQHFTRAEGGSSATWVAVDVAQLKRAIVALRVVAPDSLRAIEDLLPILYPGVKMSYGSIQAIAVEAETRAAEHNATVDLSSVVGGALDEMYSQGDPVLAGVDLDSGHLSAWHCESPVLATIGLKSSGKPVTTASTWPSWSRTRQRGSRLESRRSSPTPNSETTASTPSTR